MPCCGERPTTLPAHLRLGGERLLDQVQAQAEVVQVFSREASQAWGHYANDRQREAAQAGDAEGTECWGASGTCRAVGHVLIGGLAGGAPGALGAGAASLGASHVHAMLSEAGLGSSGADLLTAVLTTGMGAAVGGTVGAMAAFNEVNNNFLTSRQQNAFAEALNECNNDASCQSVYDHFQQLSDANKAELLEAATQCLSTEQCASFFALLDAGTPLGAGHRPVQPVDPLAPWLSEQFNAQSLAHNEQLFHMLMARPLEEEARYLGAWSPLGGFFRGANRSDDIGAAWMIGATGAVLLPGPDNLLAGAALLGRAGQAALAQGPRGSLTAATLGGGFDYAGQVYRIGNGSQDGYRPMQTVFAIGTAYYLVPLAPSLGLGSPLIGNTLVGGGIGGSTTALNNWWYGEDESVRDGVFFGVGLGLLGAGASGMVRSIVTSITPARIGGNPIDPSLPILLQNIGKPNPYPEIIGAVTEEIVSNIDAFVDIRLPKPGDKP